MLSALLILVLKTFAFFCLLRFLFQLAGANHFNPLVSAFAKVTNPVLQPLRQILPKHRLIDFSSGLAVIVLHIVIAFLGIPDALKTGVAHLVILIGVLQSIQLTCWVFIIAIILTVVMSWIAPNVYSPATELARVLTEPILRPLRKFLPAMAGFDFSPMLAMMGLFFVLYTIGQFLGT